MGKFARAMGVGAKGSVEIELPKQEFFPGEQVVGNLKLVVKEAITAESFELALVGKEHLGWHCVEEDTNSYHHAKHVIFKQEIRVASVGTAFQPGEYVFPFAFQLPPTVPGSHSLFRSGVQYVRRVTSSIMYKLQTEVKVQGLLTSNIGGERMIGVHALPKFAALPPVPKQDTANPAVTFMCCFGKGRCEITGAVSTSVVDLVNGVFRVQGTVKNNATAAVKTVYVRLYQDLALHVPQGYTQYGASLRSSSCVFQHQLPGLAPGASRDDIVADFAMPQLMAQVKPYTGNDNNRWGDVKLIQQPFNLLPVMPTTDTLFVSVSYHVAIECAYAWCPNAKLELPMQLHIPPFVAPVAPLPVGTTSPEEVGLDKGLSVQSVRVDA